MKRHKLLFLACCLVLCFVLAYGANAENVLSPKQMLLTKLKDMEFGANKNNFQKATGAEVIKVKEMSGAIMEMLPLKNTLSGAEFQLNYQLDKQNNKIAASYNVVLNNNNIKGAVYLTGDKVVFTKDILALINVFDSSFQGDKGINLPPYLYLSDDQFPLMWSSILKSQGQTVPPEFNDLLIFIVEAIPDKYFTVSLSDQKLKFSLNQDGLVDVIFSISQKVAGEKERLADILTGLALTAYQGENRETLRKDILGSLTEMVNDSDYPASAQQFRKLLAESVDLGELTYEASLLPVGSSKFNVAMNLLNKGKPLGNITGSVDWSASDGDITSGKYNYDINLISNEPYKFKADGNISGDFSQDPKKITSKCKINIGVKELNDTVDALRVTLQADSQAQAGLQSPIPEPVLTSLNSMDLKLLMNQPASNEIKVLIDGTPVYFDVGPQIRDGRTMFPLRNVAEILDCDVEWVAPDQIKISRKETLITMYVNNQMYAVNDTEKQLDAPPIIQDGRTLVPLRFIAEELGCQVDYTESLKMVTILSE